MAKNKAKVLCQKMIDELTGLIELTPDGELSSILDKYEKKLKEIK